MKQGVLLLLGFILLGCTHAPRDITLFTSAPAQPAQRLPVPVPLLLAPIDAAPVYMGKDLLYRLSYVDNQLHSYGNSSWSAPTSVLFAAVLHQTGGDNLLTLGQSHQPAHCALHIEIISFEQVFTDAQNSHAEFDLHFSLMQLLNHRELGGSKLHLEIPAPTADARGGALALDKASHQAADQIVEWLNHSLAPTSSGTNSVRTACEA
jgi:cholesterol transport system auxiliary component